MMRRFTLLFVPLCLLAGLAAGCAGSSLRGDDDAREQEIQTLKARILHLQQEAAMNQVEVAQLRQKVAELDAHSGGTRPPVRPQASSSTTAPQALPVNATPRSPLSAQASALTTTPPRPEPARPTVSAQGSAPAQVQVQAPVRREPLPAVAEPSSQPIEEVDIDLPANGPQPPRPAPKPVTVPAPKPAAPAPVVPVPAPTAAPPPAAATPPPTALPAQGESLAGDATTSPASQALYDRGYTLFHQGHFVDAETSFQRFLQANPKSDLADNAQYWIGECRYSRNDVKGALAAFRQVVEKYPKGNKVADAMLKTGQCLEAMGDVEGARVTYPRGPYGASPARPPPPSPKSGGRSFPEAEIGAKSSSKT